MICTICMSARHWASSCPFRRRGRVVAACFVALGLTGCETVQQVTGVVDTYCLTATKDKWGVDDNQESIRRAEATNATIDRRCPPPRRKKS